MLLGIKHHRKHTQGQVLLKTLILANGFLILGKATHTMYLWHREASAVKEDA